MHFVQMCNSVRGIEKSSFTYNPAISFWMDRWFDDSHITIIKFVSDQIDGELIFFFWFIFHIKYTTTNSTKTNTMNNFQFEMASFFRSSAFLSSKKHHSPKSFQTWALRMRPGTEKSSAFCWGTNVNMLKVVFSYWKVACVENSMVPLHKQTYIYRHKQTKASCIM